MNIIDESGILALSTRLQRLSEQLRKDGALFYKSYGIDFEPKNRKFRNEFHEGIII